MKPVVLPMLHLLGLHRLGFRDDGLGLIRNVGLLAARHPEHALEFVREHFDEARDGILPVVENPLGTAAAGQFHVARDKIADDLHVLTLRAKAQGRPNPDCSAFP